MGDVWDERSTKRAVERLRGKEGTMRLDETTAGLLAGRVTDGDIPPVAPRAVKVFVSATGIDSTVERTTFIEKVYPRMREYCREQYGVEFQIVDLTWGVQPSVWQADRGLPDMKIQQLLQCQAQSMGPNFLAFIGQRYGPRPLPPTIQAEEYEVLRVALHAHRGRETRNAGLLDLWYVIDNNAMPPEYVIKRPVDVIPGLGSKNDEEKAAAEEEWARTQAEIRCLLQKGADLAYLDGVMDSDTRQKYYMSELEKEIQLGITNCDNPHKRCVLILRDIVDLKNYIEDPRANVYAEIIYNDKLEQLEVPVEIEQQLQRLKNRSRGLISEANTLSHEVLWRYEDVIHPQLHAQYLAALSDQLYDCLKRLVDETAPGILANVDTTNHIAEEAMQHWTRCKGMNADFYGREEQLQQLRDYVMSYSDRPLVVYGPPGAGKTKLVSKLALELSDLVPGNLLSLIRYVGLTPKSSDLRQVLLGICSQISMALGCVPDDVPKEFKDLQKFFPELLASVPVDITVVLIFDAVEELLPDYNAHIMSWLPVNLPSHVKIILTTRTEHNILNRLQSEILRNPRCFLELRSLTDDEAEGLLIHFLQRANRCITESQMQTFRDNFTGCSLHVKLLSEEATHLHSFSDAKTLRLPETCSDGINKMFKRLEAKYGRPLISRCMAYMVASSTGLSDCEMEDLLSLDDYVLNDVFRHYHPALRRIPFAKWLQIREEVSSFLTWREADGVTVTLWEHDSFVTVIKERYLSEQNDVIQVHSMLADYFLGTWAGKKKPVEHTPGDQCGVKCPCGEAAERMVPSQPLTFQTGENEKERFNKRKYDQVPRHLHLSGRHEELNKLVLFNYEWLYNKMKALSLQHILADFALNPSAEAVLVQGALRCAATTIERDIDNLPAEITGHLLPYYATHSNIRSLIQQCDTAGLRHCALLPNFPYLAIPGSSLQYTLETPKVADHLRFVFEERYLLCKKTSESYVHVFDLFTGQLKDSIQASVGSLHVTPDGNHFLLVDHVLEKSVKIHDSGSGDFLGQIIVLNHLGIKADKYHAGPLSVTNDRLCAVVTTDTSFLCIAEIPSGEMLQIVGLDGKATVCQITPDGKHVFCNSNEFLLSYDLYTLQHTCTVPVGYKPHCIAFTADGLRAFLASSKENKLMVMHINGGTVDMTYKTGVEEALSTDEIKALKVAPNDELVLLRGDTHILVHERSQEKIVAQFLKPDEVPKEFRLPKSHYRELVFTDADFTRDSQMVVATIFRNIYIWHIASKQLITSIQAPIGVINTLLVSRRRNQLVTHLGQNREIHVWNIDSAVRKVDVPDRLTDVAQDIYVTADNSIAYAKCQNSDEVGVIDMRTGTMLDLLTHETKVHDMAITPSGHMALVSTATPRLSGTANKLWDLTERRVIHEFGSTPGYCVPMHSASSILFFHQQQAFFDNPYDISIIHFIGDTHSVHENPGACKYIRAKPFVTYDDRFVIVSSALGYNERKGDFENPCLIVFDMSASMKRTCYDANSVGLENIMGDIEKLEPCPHLQSSVAVVVSCLDPQEPDEQVASRPISQMNGDVYSSPSGSPTRLFPTPIPTTPKSSRATATPRSGKAPPPPSQHLGFFILDVRQGCITTMCVPFMQPPTGRPCPPRLVFSWNYALCMDEESTLYDLTEGGVSYGQIPNPGTPPQLFALNGTVVVYSKDTSLFVIRIQDGALIARCDVHAPICTLKLCSDERTMLVGCQDGTVASYVIVDPHVDGSPRQVVNNMRSRKTAEADEMDGRHSRSWDKVEVSSCPAYSRPPSAMSPGSKDKMILKQIKPVPRFRPKSDTLLYLNAKKSQACSVM